MNTNYTKSSPWNKKDILAYLKSHLKESRVRHVLGVAKAAKDMAERYGADVEKAELAALYHDILKDREMEWLLTYMRDHGEEPGEGLLAWKTLHAPAGAIFARETGGERDEDILLAVRYHTTGRTDMRLLEKIIFVADYIEEGRSFPGVEHLRALAEKDLNQAVLACLESSLDHLRTHNEHVLSHSLEAWAYYKKVTERKDAK